MKLEIDFPTAQLNPTDEDVLKAARETAEPSLGPESIANPDIPQGTLIAGHHTGAKIYPGVERDYWIYVPDQYDGNTPANLMVFQDGNSYLTRTNTVSVFDNLIAAGDLEPTIGVFIQPGDLAGQPKDSKANRSLEYDSVNDAYLSFLIEEFLPKTIGDYRITDNPAKRAICGMSSGGICAFNVAWERPDLFGLVVSHVGSFTNIRGGHIYPSRVRQNTKRPIRLFMQDGAADLNHGLGNWPIANFDMASSLAYRDYDFRFEFGRGAHDFVHPAAILPQTLRWIFRE